MIRTLWCWVLSKEASYTIFWVFAMTRPGIEPRSPGPLANSLRLNYNFKNYNKYLHYNPLGCETKSPITIGTIVTFMFHSFFNCLARSRYLSFFSHSFSFIPWSVGIARLTVLLILFFFFFLLIIIRSGFLVEIRWSVCMSKSHRSLCVIF